MCGVVTSRSCALIPEVGAEVRAEVRAEVKGDNQGTGQGDPRGRGLEIGRARGNRSLIFDEISGCRASPR
eukprot:scaffold14435_cov55-Phaeocystis_antarctica.AAC.4